MNRFEPRTFLTDHMTTCAPTRVNLLFGRFALASLILFAFLYGFPQKAEAQTVTINFETDLNGTPFLFGQEVTGADFQDFGIETNVNGQGQPLNRFAIFDADTMETVEDTDLTTPFAGGNGVGSPGKMLIIQDNNGNNPPLGGSLLDPNDPNSPFIFDSPDDDSSNGNIIRLIFDRPLLSFAFDTVDFDDGTETSTQITFINSGTGDQESITFAQIEAAQPGVNFDDDHYNTISALSPSGFTEFDIVEFTLGGSGGISLIEYTFVPEPGAAVLGSMALGIMCLRRRRQRQP